MQSDTPARIEAQLSSQPDPESEVVPASVSVLPTDTTKHPLFEAAPQTVPSFDDCAPCARASVHSDLFGRDGPEADYPGLAT
jgi:hypothetical protein